MQIVSCDILELKLIFRIVEISTITFKESLSLIGGPTNMHSFKFRQYLCTYLKLLWIMKFSNLDP